MKAALKFVGFVVFIFILAISLGRVAGFAESSIVDGGLRGFKGQMNRTIKRVIPFDAIEKVIKGAIR